MFPWTTDVRHGSSCFETLKNHGSIATLNATRRCSGRWHREKVCFRKTWLLLQWQLSSKLIVQHYLNTPYLVHLCFILASIRGVKMISLTDSQSKTLCWCFPEDFCPLSNRLQLQQLAFSAKKGKSGSNSAPKHVVLTSHKHKIIFELSMWKALTTFI